MPGNNERMILKSSSLASDAVVLDLEDSVPAGEKERARNLVKKMAAELEWGRRELCIRTNSTTTRWGKSDLLQLRGVPRIDAFVIPKAEGGLSAVHKQTGKKLIPIIETARGLQHIERIVSSEGVEAVTLGTADFALSVGGSVSEYLENSYLKTKVVVAARSSGVDPVDGVYFDLDDTRSFRRETLKARAMGFVGKQLIHPSQIPIANEVFSPTSKELEMAGKVVKEYEKIARDGRGALVLGGQLVDEVHYRLAKRILEDTSVSGSKSSKL